MDVSARQDLICSSRCVELQSRDVIEAAVIFERGSWFALLIMMVHVLGKCQWSWGISSGMHLIVVGSHIACQATLWLLGLQRLKPEQFSNPSKENNFGAFKKVIQLSRS